jgi:hypothetical protein
MLVLVVVLGGGCDWRHGEGSIAGPVTACWRLVGKRERVVELECTRERRGEGKQAVMSKGVCECYNGERTTTKDIERM